MSNGGVRCLRRISRTVSSLDQAVAFYCDALDFRVITQATQASVAWAALLGMPGLHAQAVTLQLGAQQLELVAFSPPGRAYPAHTDAANACFQHIAIVVSDMAAAYRRLCRHVVTPISQDGPQQLPPHNGSVTAYKFRDPDGHPLELIQFPLGIGDAAWQQTRRVFLGIDHSAIDVADIQQSVDFYTQLLGFSITSRALNSGPAQQRLDRLRGDVVDVVSLQPSTAGPPHVELLGYRHPRTRPGAADTHSTDVAADRLVLQMQPLGSLVEALRSAHVEFVSPHIVRTQGGELASLVRDPDGHHLLLCGLAEKSPARTTVDQA